MHKKLLLLFYLTLFAGGLVSENPAQESRAFRSGDLATVRKELHQLQATGNIDMRFGYNNRTALQYAASNQSDPRVLVDILDAGASLSTRCAQGSTALHYAVMFNDRVEISHLLLDRGANQFSENLEGQTPLHAAVSMGADISIIRRLLAEGGDATDPDHRGRTPLHFADRVEVASLLIENGANIHARSDSGQLPLHSACLAGKTRLVTDYISRGVNVNAIDRYGNSLLHTACASHRNSRTIAILIESGADASYHNPRNHSALMVALRTSLPPETIKLLLSAGADPNQAASHSSTLDNALLSDHAEECIGLLLDFGLDPYTSPRGRQTLFEWALSRDSISAEFIQSLADKGVPLVESDHPYPKPVLMLAARKKVGTGVVRSLIEAGAGTQLDLRRDDRTLLYRYASYAKPSLLELLIESGQRVDARTQRGESILMRAASANPNTSAIRALIEAGADVHARDTRGWAPVHYAGKNPRAALIVRELVKHGADPNARDSRGYQPIHIAAETLNFRGLDSLVKSGIDINSTLEASGESPLSLACGSLGLSPNGLTQLLNAGANPNQKSHSGETPLMRLANRFPEPDLIKILLNAGANPAHTDSKGRTALDYFHIGLLNRSDIRANTVVLELLQTEE